MNEFTIEAKWVKQEDKIADRVNAEVIIQGLHEYFANLTGCSNYDLLSVYVRNTEGRIVGGLLSYITGEWLCISHLWIEEAMRGQGYGSKLVKMAEEKVKEIGCKYAAIDTQNPKAKQLYEKLGYEVFGKLANNPREGFTRFYLSKTL